MQALQVASRLLSESRRFERDAVVYDRLQYGAALLENVASGLLHGAERAAIQNDDAHRAWNPWRTGREPVDPSIARDYFAQSSLQHAAEYSLKIFISNPFLYAHMQVGMPPASTRLDAHTVCDPPAGPPPPPRATP